MRGKKAADVGSSGGPSLGGHSGRPGRRWRNRVRSMLFGVRSVRSIYSIDIFLDKITDERKHPLPSNCAQPHPYLKRKLSNKKIFEGRVRGGRRTLVEIDLRQTKNYTQTKHRNSWYIKRECCPISCGAVFVGRRTFDYVEVRNPAGFAQSCEEAASKSEEVCCRRCRLYYYRLYYCWSSGVSIQPLPYYRRYLRDYCCSSGVLIQPLP